MLEYFNQYILSVSSKRAKLFVYLNAQILFKVSLIDLKKKNKMFLLINCFDSINDDVKLDILVSNKSILQSIINQIQRLNFKTDQFNERLKTIYIKFTMFIINVHDFKVELTVNARSTSKIDLNTFEE